MSNLLIVESPAKAKTIQKYLGPGYKVVASMGHIRDLPKSKIGVDIEHDFEPQYIVIRGKAELVNKIKKEAKNSKHVYLATDPDREGEAISWHLAKLLSINPLENCRVVFNEITKSAVSEAIKQPLKIDEKLVNAQQARRVLDRIVGYKLSPMLWRKIKTGLSAGRVQTVTTKLIVDREEEIKAFVPQEYHIIDAALSSQNGGKPFVAKFFGSNKKIELNNADEANAVLSAVKNAEFKVANIKKSKKTKSPPPPFITSTLQQEASRRLNFTSRKTMQIAQELYEGIEIGTTTTGLITYMRTDSLRISNDALNDVRKFISDKYGEKNLPKTPRFFKQKNNSQDAHEAVRPTDVKYTPDEIKKSLSRDQYRLYKIIWERFVASQMESLIQDTVSVDIGADKYIFKAFGYTVSFEGYSTVYQDSKDDDEEESALPNLNVGNILTLKELKSEQKFTQPPSRYTEASLIKALEENGIGRPSTYAPTITTILSRDYVKKDGKTFAPTPLGVATTNLMTENFSNIVNIEFTAEMENELDKIEMGERSWVEILNDFYSVFSKTMKDAEEKLEGVRIKVPEEVTEEICENCGKNMVVRSSKYGKFLACPGYPECKNTKQIVEDTGKKCPKCGARLLLKKSKAGKKYFGCEKNPSCDFMSWDEPIDEKCPRCNSVLLQKKDWRKQKYCSNKECSYVENGKK